MNKCYKYASVISWSKNDDSFIAEVPELWGSAAGGETYRKALSDVETEIEEWIETGKPKGRGIPLPKGKLIYA